MSVLNVPEIVDTDWHDANRIGEVLRDYLFVNDENRKWFSEDENYKQLGCYETFRVRKDAVLIPKWKSNDLFNKYAYDVPSPGSVNGRNLSDGTSAVGYEFTVATDKGKTKVYAVWHWKLTGTLIFEGHDFALVNDDCQYQNTWVYSPVGD